MTDDELKAAQLAEADAREAGQLTHAAEIRRAYKDVRQWLATNGLNKATVIEMIDKRIGEIAQQYIEHHMTTGWLVPIVERNVKTVVKEYVERSLRLASAKAAAQIQIEFVPDDPFGTAVKVKA